MDECRAVAAFTLGMRQLVLLIAACGCGSGSDRPPGASATQATVAAAPPAASPAPQAPTVTAPPAPLPACTDGGDSLAGAVITRDDVRFCLREDKTETCWVFELASRAIRPLARATALASADPASVAVAGDRDDRPGVAASWTAKVDDGAIEICGPAGCKPFAVVPGKSPDDDMGVEAAAVSASGLHVAVTRGVLGLAHMTLEIYDRASGRRLGVARPKATCTHLEGFAGETAVVEEWDCANQGGNRLLVAPNGKIIARITRWYSRLDSYAQIAGDRWEFAGRGDGSIEIYDVAAGTRLGGRELEQFVDVVTAHERAYAFEPSKARVIVFGADGKELASGRVPTCRYEWEVEAFGPLHLLMKTTDVVTAIGPPVRKTKPDPEHSYESTWTYASGVTLVIHANTTDMITGAAVPPYLVVGMALAAPSKLHVHGAGIGSTAAQLEAALGSHLVAARTSATRRVAGNDGDSGGIVFELADGKVSRISIGELGD